MTCVMGVSALERGVQHKRPLLANDGGSPRMGRVALRNRTPGPPRIADSLPPVPNSLHPGGAVAAAPAGKLFVSSHCSDDPGGGTAWVLELEAGSSYPKTLPFNEDVGGLAVDTAANV